MPTPCPGREKSQAAHRTIGSGADDKHGLTRPGCQDTGRLPLTGLQRFCSPGAGGHQTPVSFWIRQLAYQEVAAYKPDVEHPDGDGFPALPFKKIFVSV